MPERSWRCSILFHQRSPWFFDHGGLFDEDAGSIVAAGAEEVEEIEVGSGDGGEELPAGEDGGFGCVGICGSHPLR